jgi:hypothetical protein
VITTAPQEKALGACSMSKPKPVAPLVRLFGSTSSKGNDGIHRTCQCKNEFNGGHTVSPIHPILGLPDLAVLACLDTGCLRGRHLSALRVPTDWGVAIKDATGADHLVVGVGAGRPEGCVAFDFASACESPIG